MSGLQSNLERQHVLIRENFNVLSKIVKQQALLVRALFNREATRREKDAEMETNETVIDSLEVKIRTEVINGIVLYTPRAAESRQMFAYIDITGFLERIGDLLHNIGKMSDQIVYETEPALQIMPRLSRQLDLVSKMTEDSIVAFTLGDSDLARDVITRDLSIDAEHRSICDDLPDLIDKGDKSPASIRTALILNTISYNIERIGDNATNVAESAIYHSEGKNARHVDLFPQKDNQ